MINMRLVKASERKIHISRKAYRKVHPDKARESSKRYHQAHPEKAKLYRQAHPDKVREWNRESQKRYNKAHGKLHRRETKIEVLSHYSNGSPRCAKCGEARLAALSIDHINDDGAEHRRQIKSFSYWWLKREGYPEGFQVLCMNCQWIKREENGEVRGSKGKSKS